MNKYFSLLIITLLFFSCKKEEGCMDPTALNYNSDASVDDGSCIPFIYGCMDSTMFNYNPLANEDYGSCIPFIYGCMDSTMFNYNPLANVDDGSCNYAPISNLKIHFTQTVDGNPIILNQMIYTNQANDNYDVQTVRYLISDITLHADDGTSTLLDEVHYVDISIASSLILNIPEITNKNYNAISFTMGLNAIKNVTNLFLNESFFPAFAWPEFLGGGYHYMQLEGDYTTIFQGYATHTGGTNGLDFSFTKNFPIVTNIESGKTITINMEINNWYSNPHTINLEDDIMEDPNAQALLKDNGVADVFSVIINQ